MVSQVKKRVKYNKDMCPKFYEYCSQGLTLTQIAEKLEVLKEDFFTWAEDKRKYEWQAAWARGKQAAQAYHEAKLRSMIDGDGRKVSAKELDMQMKYLQLQFKQDWSEKQEIKIDVSPLEKLNNEQIAQGIVAKLTNPVIARELLKQIQGSTTPRLSIVNSDTDDSETDSQPS